MYLVSNQRYCLPMPFAHAFGAGPSRWASRMSLALDLTCVLAGILLCAGIVRAQEGGDLRDLRVGLLARRAAPGARCSQGPAPPLGRSPPRPTTSRHCIGACPRRGARPSRSACPLRSALISTATLRLTRRGAMVLASWAMSCAISERLGMCRADTYGPSLRRWPLHHGSLLVHRINLIR
jgi:hypothetical protein